MVTGREIILVRVNELHEQGFASSAIAEMVSREFSLYRNDALDGEAIREMIYPPIDSST